MAILICCSKPLAALEEGDFLEALTIGFTFTAVMRSSLICCLKSLEALEEGDLLEALACDAVELVADLVELVEDEETVNGWRLLDGLELIGILLWQRLLAVCPSTCIFLPPPLHSHRSKSSQVKAWRSSRPHGDHGI